VPGSELSPTWRISPTITHDQLHKEKQLKLMIPPTWVSRAKSLLVRSLSLYSCWRVKCNPMAYELNNSTPEWISIATVLSQNGVYPHTEEPWGLREMPSCGWCLSMKKEKRRKIKRSKTQTKRNKKENKTEINLKKGWKVADSNNQVTETKT